MTSAGARVEQMNDGQNRVGLIVDPERDELPFSFTVEVFEAGTVTEMAVNPGFELFYVLQGTGTAFCEGEEVRLRHPHLATCENTDV